VSQLNSFVASHLGAVGLVIFIGCVVVLLLVGMLFIQSRRIALLSQRIDALTQGAEGQSLEAVLDSHMESVVRVTRDLDEMQARTAVLEGNARLHFARLGLVRFNPFEGDTGGNQSFALSMLDANNDGFVITSLHTRTGTRIYAKAVFGGEAEATLGEEEAKAVEIAASQGGVPTAGAPSPAKGRRVGFRAAGRTKSVGAPPLPKEAVAPKPAAPAPPIPAEAAPPKEAVAPKQARGKAASKAPAAEPADGLDGTPAPAAEPMPAEPMPAEAAEAAEADEADEAQPSPLA
jgi:hypothetical protein